MLRVEANELPVLEWRTNAVPAVGSWLATPGAGDEPTAIGVVSVLPRKAPAPNGVLGIVLDEDPLGPRIQQVLAESAAEKAGLMVNDLVLEVNGKATKDRRTLIDTVRGHQPGERVRLLIKRGDDNLTINATLADRYSPEPMDRNDFQNSLGGELSTRRAGFASVLQHDTVLSPNQCGGPIVDSEGKAVGINIARAGRVASFALPSEVILPLIEDLKSGKLAPVSVSEEAAPAGEAAPAP
jgi:serine protease Do